MPQLSTGLATFVAARYGAVSKPELIGDGYTDNTIRRMVSADTIISTHRQVYRLATAPDSFEFRCAAACLADTSAVVTGPAAARLWRFRHVWQPETPIVLVAHDCSPLHRGVLIRRTNALSPDEIAERSDGIRLASPPRAWFDCARDLSDEKFEMLTEWVLDEHASMPTLWRTLRRLSQRGRPGLARVRRVVSQRSAWQKPAGSGLELKVLKALQQAGLPELVRQHPIKLPDKTVIHPDGALPGIRWAVEIDHVTWHGGRLDAQHDKGRNRRLRRVGWHVERVTDAELREDFAGTIREVVELFHLRRSELAA